ncbi:hypothetical protein [Streptomyces sp. NPDC102409]|uniref:hypothetical protein n=1 Tax=Streptomyces sp. NPDC102409 TaxID=3366172 RepID=UPI0037FA59DA
MAAPTTAAALSVAHDPELMRVIEQYIARRRRERLRRSVERSLAQRLLGATQPEPPASRPPAGRTAEPGGTP